MDLIECPAGRRLIDKYDLLRISHSGKEATDRVSWDLPREEQPIYRAVERKLRRRTGEDQQDQIRTPPDRTNDRISGNKVAHLSFYDFAKALPRAGADYFLRVDEGHHFSRLHFSHNGLRA